MLADRPLQGIVSIHQVEEQTLAINQQTTFFCYKNEQKRAA